MTLDSVASDIPCAVGNVLFSGLYEELFYCEGGRHNFSFESHIKSDDRGS